MFRISQFMQALKDPHHAKPIRKPKGPVVIWNLIRRCNLHCKHCYSISADTDFPGELSTEQIFTVLQDLQQFHVPAIIFSGGEPLLRPDIYTISRQAKKLGFYIGLSTNGTLIDAKTAAELKDIGYDYIGISIDGIQTTHDAFRRMSGAYEKSLNAIRTCHEHGIKVGLRFTLTQDNAKELPLLLELLDQEQLEKFYLSHLNYAGRGNRNRKDDVIHQTTRWAMNLLFQRSWQDVQNGRNTEFVTGNNDADGVYLYHWIQQYHPDKADFILQRLQQWGGNASGVNVANIDNLGEVHPDTFWWNYPLGNVKTRAFSEIWQDTRDPFMQGLKSTPRPLQGRCGICQFQNICNGNTRVRAYQLTGNFWEEDPACYLDDNEIGVTRDQPRIKLTPYKRIPIKHVQN